MVNMQERSGFQHNSPVHFIKLTGAETFANSRLNELQKKVFIVNVDNKEPDWKDVRRQKFIFNNTEFVKFKHENTDEYITQVFSELSEDVYVQYFLRHHFNQQDILYAGVDEFLHALNGISPSLSKPICFLNKQEDGSVICRVIIHAHDFRNIEDPTIPLLESEIDQPIMVFDTTYAITPISILEGVKVKVREHYQAVYHPDLEKKLKEIIGDSYDANKISLTEKNYLFAINHSGSENVGALVGSSLALLALVATRSYASSASLLFNVVNTMLQYDTPIAILTTSAIVTASSVTVAAMIQAAGSYLESKGKLLSAYSDLLNKLVEENGLELDDELKEIFHVTAKSVLKGDIILEIEGEQHAPNDSDEEETLTMSSKKDTDQQSVTKFSMFRRSNSMPELSQIKHIQLNDRFKMV